MLNNFMVKQINKEGEVWAYHIHVSTWDSHEWHFHCKVRKKNNKLACRSCHEVAPLFIERLVYSRCEKYSGNTHPMDNCLLYFFNLKIGEIFLSNTRNGISIIEEQNIENKGRWNQGYNV